VARYEADNSYYRVEIVDLREEKTLMEHELIPQTRTIHVYFIDYGM